MVSLGFEPGAKGWQALTKPQSYGGRRRLQVLLDLLRYFIVPNWPTHKQFLR